MTAKEILKKQENSLGIKLTEFISPDGDVWEMVENAMAEYHLEKLKLLGIGGVSNTLQILKKMNFVYPDTKLQKGGDYGDDPCIELIDVVGFEIDPEKEPLRQRIYL